MSRGGSSKGDTRHSHIDTEKIFEKVFKNPLTKPFIYGIINCNQKRADTHKNGEKERRI
jgi:hypothetical protein